MAAQRSGLTLVSPSAREYAEQVAFCSHCAVTVPAHESDARVCASCGLGLILTADSTLAPVDDGAFLVLDSSLAVCAVSRAAEDLLAITETSAVNRHITAFLSPAESEPRAARDLAVSVARAVRGIAGNSQLTLRPVNTFGVRLNATIGPCGPQPAALLLLEDIE